MLKVLLSSKVEFICVTMPGLEAPQQESSQIQGKTFIIDIPLLILVSNRILQKLDCHQLTYTSLFTADFRCWLYTVQPILIP